MNKFKSGLLKTAKFLRKNIYYVLIIVAVAAIGTMVAVALTRDKTGSEVPVVQTPIDNNTDKPIDENLDNKPEKPIDEHTPTPVLFINPVSGGAVSASFSDTELVFSNTLEQWSAHLAVDFTAAEGTAVSAVYAGKVTSIENDSLMGYTVIVDHSDGLITRYCGLNENIAVSVGETVTQGAKIGEVGNTMILESADGPHLHFETLKNGELVNPAEYFVSENK